MSPAFFNACWFTRPACIVTLYIGAVMSSIAFLFLVDASPAPSEQAFDPHCTCLALFRWTCADTSHTHPWHCWHDPSFFIIIILVLIPALTFSFFFFSRALFLCTVAFDFCSELTVQEMCAGKNFCSIHCLSLPFPSSTAAGMIAGLMTECSTFITQRCFHFH